MHTEITKFARWLRCKKPHTSTHIHYTSDLRLFFNWVDKPPTEVTVSDIDGYIAHCQVQGHAIATINRRLAALSAFYQFLQANTDNHQPTRSSPAVTSSNKVAVCPAMWPTTTLTVSLSSSPRPETRPYSP